MVVGTIRWHCPAGTASKQKIQVWPGIRKTCKHKTDASRELATESPSGIRGSFTDEHAQLQEENIFAEGTSSTKQKDATLTEGY